MGWIHFNILENLCQCFNVVTYSWFTLFESLHSHESECKHEYERTHTHALRHMDMAHHLHAYMHFYSEIPNVMGFDGRWNVKSKNLNANPTVCFRIIFL